jgi:hypothetical protein
MFLHASARLFTRTWLIDALDRASGPLPEMRNTDGDEIVFSEARFPITDKLANVIAGSPTCLDRSFSFDYYLYRSYRRPPGARHRFSEHSTRGYQFPINPPPTGFC